MSLPTHTYKPAIDGLRAIAVLGVIIFHLDFIDLLPGGFTGVDLFFVISGYVISQSLWERRNLTFGRYLKDFYRRRLLRIMPALLTVLCVSFIASAMFMPQFWLSELIHSTGIAAFFGLSNVVLAWNTDTYFSPSTELNPYLHTWSLGVEEQFYVIFPALFYLWLRYRRHTPIAWVALPLMAVVSLIVGAWQVEAAPLSAFYLLPGRFWELAVGAILFQLIGTRAVTPHLCRLAPTLLAIGLGLVVTGFLFADPSRFPFPWAVVTVAGAVAMIAGTVLRADSPPSAVQRVLQNPLAAYVGRLSYSLYLWHWPVAVFLRWTTGLEWLVVQLLYPLLVIALAAASYHWIETPIRSGQSMVQRNAWLTFVTGAMATTLLWLSALWVTQNTSTLSLSQTRDTYTWYAYRHYPQEDIDTLDDPSLQGRQLFVIGDSHTAAYRTLLKLVSLRLGIQVVEYEEGGCSVVSLIGPDPARCANTREAQLKQIEEQAKPGDIVFLASLRMPELNGREWRNGEAATVDEALSELTADNLSAARSAADTLLSRLQGAQFNVLIDAPKPVFKAAPNRCSDWFNRMNPVCAPGLTMARDQLERLRAPQMQLLQQLQADYPALYAWDPLPLLCPGPTCSAYDESAKPLFFDTNHLSGHGNRVLEPSFTAALLKIWGVTPPLTE
ncbi:acyltransferase family protein [Pseudomonas sp. FP597]|uniref:acyltransferase family protein n=1 Tax=Pseudomonas sp. FP597 TaxID=2954096 RepID=UPI0027374D68|nr:acyltransferase family protein [Pseudomonas sp. FP597]WLI06503.1 acyltransferase family protein [Pseudomonas sp. FP597]